MDLAQVINELWKHRGWLLVGALVALFAGISTAYSVGLLPPSLEKKSLGLAGADTQVLIDTPQSSLTDLGIGLEPLAERASVYARFMTSRPVRAAIAQEVGLREDQLITETPPTASGATPAGEPTRLQRTNELLDEDKSYRLMFATEPGLPTITINAQAPRVDDAVRLADAGAAGFANYVKAVQAKQNVPAERRVTVRQLGRADGGALAESINTPLALLTFLAVFIASCLLILLGTNVSRGLREVREREQGDTQPTTELPS